MKVLIIDDHEMNVALLKNLMMAKVPDCETFCYTESAEALAWCNENESDLVLVDYMMPTPNGLEFIEFFRKLPGKQDIPIVMITAVNEKEIRLKAIEHGANDFINKPIDTAELTARVRNMLALRKSQKALANRAEWLAEEVRKATAEIIEREREIIIRLTRAAEYRDPETGMHIVRMAHYCKLIAKSIGLSQEDQELILDSSPMHDIGKVGIADFILLKGEHLNDEEFNAMKKHTEMGYEILQGSKSKLLQMAATIARCHHEKFDGTGYPDGIRDYDIPLVARICALCDVFDALMSRRPYKEPWTLDDTLREIDRRVGTHFDPDLVAAFKRVLPEILEIQKKFTPQ